MHALNTTASLFRNTDTQNRSGAIKWSRGRVLFPPKLNYSLCGERKQRTVTSEINRCAKLSNFFKWKRRLSLTVLDVRDEPQGYEHRAQMKAQPLRAKGTKIIHIKQTSGAAEPEMRLIFTQHSRVEACWRCTSSSQQWTCQIWEHSWKHLWGGKRVEACKNANIKLTRLEIQTHRCAGRKTWAHSMRLPPPPSTEGTLYSGAWTLSHPYRASGVKICYLHGIIHIWA